jgi:hypothetical protein
MKMGLIATAIAMMAGASAAIGAGTEYEGTACGHTKVTLLQAGPELTVLVTQFWGVHTPSSTFEPWKNATLRCVSYRQILQGKVAANGACQWTDATGDTFTGETRESTGQPGQWTFLHGTGKWKGIQGGGTWKVVSSSKPAKDGTVELCFSHQGTYVLPQK